MIQVSLKVVSFKSENKFWEWVGNFIGKEQQYSSGILVGGCDVSTGHLPCEGEVLLKKVFFYEVGNNDLILANLQTEGLKGSRSHPYLICLLENNCEITESSLR